MQPIRLGMIALALLSLAACKRPNEAPASDTEASAHGRYVGIGIYDAGTPWSKMIQAEATPTNKDQPKDEAAAKTIDDQVIIVVEDSKTGEVRACGDLTGYCIGMNPWNKALLPSQIAPIRLSEHIQPPEPDPNARVTVKATVAAAPSSK